MKKKIIITLALIMLLQTACSTTNAKEKLNDTENSKPAVSKTEEKISEEAKAMPTGESKEYSKEELVLIVKKAFDISDDFAEVSIDLEEGARGKVYYVNWNDPDSERDISATIATTGEVLSYYSYDGSESRDKELIVPAYTYEQGAKIAREYLNKILGEKADFFRIDETSSGEIDRYRQAYNYRFNKFVNDIQVEADGISISLDINTEKVKEFDLHSSIKNDLYDISYYQDPKDIVDNDDAWQVYKNYNPLLLNLKRIVDYKTKSLFPTPNYISTYEFNTAHIVIDAKTGKPEKKVLYYGYDDIAKEEAPAEMPKEGLTAIEQQEIENTNVKVSPEEAEKLAREIAKLNKSYELKNIRLGKYNHDEKKQLWSMHFENDKNNVSIDIDANDKTLLNMSKNSFSREDSIDVSKIDPEKSIQAGKEFAKKYAADILDQLEMTPASQIPDNGYLNSIDFIRKLDDNYYLIQDRISVGINPKNYEVVSYARIFYDDMKAPNKKIIDLDKAYNILYDNVDFDLSYVANNDRTKMELKYKLSPRPSSSLIIDAKDGQFLDWQGKTIAARTSGYEDIDKAENQEKIELLSRYSIKYLGSKLEPKTTVKQKDFLLLIMATENRYYGDNEDYDPVYDYAFRNKILNSGEENRELELTRKDIAKYLIRFKGIEDISKLEGVFKDVYSDAAGDGNLILAGKLGWIEAQGDKILPNDEVSREEALMIFYNMMFN